MKIVAIIQARVGSTRLPGKVLLPLCGQPMLWHIVERVKRATRLDEVLLTAPLSLENRPVGAIGQACGVRTYWWDGEEADLVGRYLAAATWADAEIVVRVCADNPCVEWTYLDEAIETYLDEPLPFYSNTTAMGSTKGQVVYVDGLGAEVLSLSRLQWLDRKTRGRPEWREHPHAYFKFVLPPASLRLDVNTPEEYAFIEDLYAQIYPQTPAFTIADVLAYLATKEPDAPADARPVASGSAPPHG